MEEIYCGYAKNWQEVDFTEDSASISPGEKQNKLISILRKEACLCPPVPFIAVITVDC